MAIFESNSIIKVTFRANVVAVLKTISGSDILST